MRLKRANHTPFVFGLIVVLIAGYAWHNGQGKKQTHEKEYLRVNGPRIQTDAYKHPIAFYDAGLVSKGITSVEQNEPARDYVIQGVIVPHHTFATHLIAQAFSLLTSQNPESIILLGPNHYERGGFTVLSSEHPWLTPFGDLAPHSDWVMALEMQGLIRQQPEVLSQDHAVAAIMPYLKYYLPQARVLPLLLSGHTTERELDVLAASLHEWQQPKTVIVAAVDFSHYLSSAEAKQKDKETWHVITSYDYGNLMQLTNKNLDSPASIALLLKLMQLRASTRSELLANTNSGELTGEINAPTTSYFTVLYH